MSDGQPPRDDFDARLARAREARGGKQAEGEVGSTRRPMPAMGMGFRIGVDLVAALLVGVGIGYLLDMWLGTGPWLLVVFIFLGFGAGILNVYRAINGIDYAVGYRGANERVPAPASDDEPGAGRGKE